MKIIKFQNKVNDYQYFINETELVDHLKNVVFKNEPEALINNLTGKELSNESDDDDFYSSSSDDD